MLSKRGLFTYKCLANNTAGTANSTSVNITGGGKYDILSILSVYEALVLDLLRAIYLSFTFVLIDIQALCWSVMFKEKGVWAC